MAEGSFDRPKKAETTPILKKGTKMDANKFLERVSEQEETPRLDKNDLKELMGTEDKTDERHSSGFGSWQKRDIEERGTGKR